jgi:LmbE family N-acetylglucosaminyl deacetylase
MTHNQTEADLHIPDNAATPEALRRTTHLGIGAHQDDLEFMALHGILACHGSTERWFGGVICTDGAGSARSGAFADYTDEQMREVRIREQHQAADIGQYAFVAQLGYPSSGVKDADRRQSLVADLVQILETARPERVYAHNPFDKHPTHVAVCLATVEAIRRLPTEARPRQLLGCEVWRSLDWLPHALKVVQPLDDKTGLAGRLNAVFASQIAGGKRYDLAVEGRRRANATFIDAHATDTVGQAAYAIDLTPLIQDHGPALKAFMEDILAAFGKNCTDLLGD